MAGRVLGATLLGVDAVKVDVEVDLLRRLPAVVIVGMASTSVRESADRVRSALLASGFEFPRQRVVVGLAPGDLRKDGPAFDLPIALGILSAAGQLDPTLLSQYLVVGELSLEGELRPLRGGLAFACLARDLGKKGILLPAPSAAEAALVDGIEVRAAERLEDAVAFLAGDRDLPLGAARRWGAPASALDLRDVRGQEEARGALEVAAAGGHNLLMEGPPGCGKTMLAARLPSILPRMTAQEALECTRVHSVAGLHPADAGVMDHRPFRAPHHTVSAAGLIGGASLRPGEVSLAHNGVLFLDEFPEFPRPAREVLRGPLEDRRVVLARSTGHVVLPAAFMLVAAANPCPCGNLGHPRLPCSCAPGAWERYRARLSGPLIDRIDLRVELPPVDPGTLLTSTNSESSDEVRQRVEAARARQRARYGDAVSANAELQAHQVLEACNATTRALALLQRHLEAGGASARVGRRLLKVARTLADLDGAPLVEVGHVARAVGLRSPLDERVAS